jgi:hypothetical protein
MREDGVLIITPLDSDKPTAEFITIQCVVCGRHGYALLDGQKPIAEQLRISADHFGWSEKLGGPVCSEKCQRINVVQEQYLENLSKGVALDFAPIMAPVGIDLS